LATEDTKENGAILTLMATLINVKYVSARALQLKELELPKSRQKFAKFLKEEKGTWPMRALA